MHFKTNLKAGILLYAMFMASVFLLVLQLYLYQTTHLHKEYQAQRAYVKARLMAEMIHQSRVQGSGHLFFKEGQATYRCQKDQLVITVALDQTSHHQFNYSPLYPESQQANVTIDKKYQKEN
ncbi:competence type IV pilus minor pilin ComGG [Streptococcus castoreus]|uniref:competence type IV pilus minor pilin ComGG n=1 Tax=Streptococcus castoreus TaxID=254786 RepID=UPI000425BDE5|nr:competence type IV pilus minor pilin ComGG [Streptococcus castoreus]